MSTSVVDIYNWALAAVGTRSRVQSTTEASNEAEACTIFYENVRDQILRSAPWDCARAYKRLAQNAERDSTIDWVATDPAPGWTYAFALPADFIWPRFISTFARFELGISSTDQRVLYTNDAEPILCYTKRQTRVDLWDADLQAAVGFALGAHICMKLTGSESKTKLVTGQAIDKILAARQAAANAPNFSFDSVPEWIAARGYGGVTPSMPYLYPSAEFSYAGFSSALA